MVKHLPAAPRNALHLAVAAVSVLLSIWPAPVWAQARSEEEWQRDYSRAKSVASPATLLGYYFVRYGSPSVRLADFIATGKPRFQNEFLRGYLSVGIAASGTIDEAGAQLQEKYLDATVWAGREFVRRLQTLVLALDARERQDIPGTLRNGLDAALKYVEVAKRDSASKAAYLEDFLEILHLELNCQQLQLRPSDELFRTWKSVLWSYEKHVAPDPPNAMYRTEFETCRGGQ